MIDIEHGEQIPALSAGVTDLLRALTDEQITFAELREKISHFPSITSRILFLANSAWAAPLVPISSLDLACSKVGISVIRSVSLAMSIAAPFNPVRCKGFDSRTYWLSSLLVAETAKILATKVNSIPEECHSSLHTAGVLHNIGLIWLADRFPQLTSTALTNARIHPQQSIGVALHQHAGLGYADISGKLAEAWNFPELLVTTLTHHNNAKYNGPHADAVHTIGLATKLVDQLLSEAVDDDFSDIRIEKLTLTSEAVVSVRTLMEKRLQNFFSLVEVYLSAH